MGVSLNEHNCELHLRHASITGKFEIRKKDRRRGNEDWERQWVHEVKKKKGKVVPRRGCEIKATYEKGKEQCFQNVGRICEFQVTKMNEGKSKSFWKLHDLFTLENELKINWGVKP